MDNFRQDLEVGEIHMRDNLQFELKSDFTPIKNVKGNTYTQEFYFFIPKALQVNQDTYTFKQFYRDQTKYIRYKTPEFTLEQILDPNNHDSPLVRLKEKADAKEIEYELKLLGNIVRSSLRACSRRILENPTNEEIHTLSKRIQEFRERYRQIDHDVLENQRNPLVKSYFFYVDEFISDSINFYLTGILESVRHSQNPEKDLIDTEIVTLLRSEKRLREEKHKEPSSLQDDAMKREFVLYRRGLLHKFVLDALLLNTSRQQMYRRYRNVIAAFAAGVAMLFFFLLFVWQGQVFIINSTPFIVITVFLYILKDRIKEGIREISYKQFHKIYPDYRTDIRNADQSVVGNMTESFSFITERELPQKITKIRNREFHAVLDEFKRPEEVIYYKKKLTLFECPKARRYALNVIFRYNINHFLTKAENPFIPHTTVDSHTGKLIHEKLPKVYHVNIILKNTFLNESGKEETELKKFRLILDKNGIKRVEHLT